MVIGMIPISTICRSTSGKSPMMWISEYVIEDIIHYLKNTDLTAKEISEALGFPNASFFGKYVRVHLGASPSEYRKQLLNAHKSFSAQKTKRSKYR